MNSALRTTRALTLAAGLVGSILAIGGSTPTAAAPPTAAVAVGDSFISGEGAGDYDAVVDRDGISQGYQDFSAPNDNAYFCHRSPNAEVEVAALAGIDERFNIACSGAVPRDIGLPSFTRDRGRLVASQIEQLRAIAATHDIDLVVVDLGANSVGFGDVASKCIGKFLTDAFTGWWEGWINIFSPHATTTGACGASDFPNRDALARAEADVLASGRLILNTLAAIDADGEHRVVFQDYVNPLPADFASRFHEEDGRRDTRDKFRSLARERYAAGCPVHRGTLPHAQSMSQGLGTMVRNVHDRLRVEFPTADLVYLDVQRAFDGARLCEIDSSPAGALHAPTRAVTSADGRVQHTLDGNKLDVRDLFENCTSHFQRCQEIWHPNAAGHGVLGRCLSAAWTTTAPLVDCARQANGQITTTVQQPVLHVNASGHSIGGGGRSGQGSLRVSASYDVSLRDAPGLTITAVTVNAWGSSGALEQKTTLAGSYTYTTPCVPGTVGVTLTVSATLSDGSTLAGSGSSTHEVPDCDGKFISDP